MEVEDQRKVLEDVFGESSSTETDIEDDKEELSSPHNLPSTYNKHALNFLSPSIKNPNDPTWERIESINGLWICRDFLSPLQQSSLLSSILNEGWFTEAAHNQAMRFGDLPLWALKLSDHVHEVVCIGGKETDTGMLNVDDKVCILPSQLLWRDPFFDQLIVNMYEPGEGICAHVDLMRFEDGIAIVSLESPCVMHFSPVVWDGEEVPLAKKIPVYLAAGSLIIMWGDARYQWKHEITRKPGFQVWQGREIEQTRRTSITLRKLCVSE